MHSYVKDFANMEKMLTGFLQHGIDIGKLDILDHVIESSDVDQIKILNSYRSLVEQRVLFGAIKNINSVIRVMKEKLKIAREIHENPTTIESSLEIVEYLSNIAPYIDEFLNKNKLGEMNRINELSRSLYRKANHLGFYRDIDTQLEEAGITKEEVKTFVEKLKENIELEMETGDEPLDENNSGNISSD